MAPLGELLEAAGARSAELDAEAAAAKTELSELDQQVADKRAEKTIAAQNAVRELLKSKETLMKKCKVLDAAAGHVRLALAKLQRTKAAGLDDWKDLKEEKVQLSDFAADRLQDPAALAGVEASSGGGKVVVEGSVLTFTGSTAGLESLKKAVAELDSAYSCALEADTVVLRAWETRGVFKRFSEKFGVAVSGSNGQIAISGAPDKARSAEKSIKFHLAAKADIPVSREHQGACKAHVKDVEAETGTYIEVLRGGFGGGSIVHIRGDTEGVKEAEEQVRNWLDMREGRYSAHVEVSTLKALAADKVQEFSNDLWHFGQKFGIDATLQDLTVELRGPADKDWEAGARAELKMIVDWYGQQAAGAAQPQAKAKAEVKPAPADDDDWGAAPEAEIELGHKWK